MTEHTYLYIACRRFLLVTYLSRLRPNIAEYIVTELNQLDTADSFSLDHCLTRYLEDKHRTAFLFLCIRRSRGEPARGTFHRFLSTFALQAGREQRHQFVQGH